MADVKPVSEREGTPDDAQVSPGRHHVGALTGQSIEQHLLRMVLYYDVFAHPLTRAELARLVAPSAPDRVDQGCAKLHEAGLVDVRGPWVSAPGRLGTLRGRQERARWAEVAWPRARLAARALAALPFVGGLLVTGSLSKNSTTPSGDVDFLVLVQPGRVWTLKSILQILRRPLPTVIHELVCTNYLLSSDALALDDRNLFTAMELATAVPMHGREACVALLQANDWARRFIPGFDWSIARARTLPPASPRVRRPPGRLGARVESTSLQLWNAYWDRKYAWLPERVRDHRFKRSAERATNHLHDFQDYVLGETAARLQAAGLHEALTLGSAA